jgi:hypothetical protein
MISCDVLHHSPDFPGNQLVLNHFLPISCFWFLPFQGAWCHLAGSKAKLFNLDHPVAHAWQEKLTQPGKQMIFAS